MILKNIEIIDQNFFNQKFANRILGPRTLRIGNIISFVSPVDITTDKNYKSEESINFCIEMPDISVYAGACFSELFITNLASILGSRYVDSTLEIVNSDIIIKKEHTQAGIHQMDGIISLSQMKYLNNSILFYVGLYNRAGESATPRAYSLKFDVDKANKFMDDVNSGFYNLANNIFLKTSKL